MDGHFLFIVVKRGKVVTFFDILFKVVQTLKSIKNKKHLSCNTGGREFFHPLTAGPEELMVAYSMM